MPERREQHRALVLENSALVAMGRAACASGLVTYHRLPRGDWYAKRGGQVVTAAEPTEWALSHYVGCMLRDCDKVLYALVA